MKDAAVGTLSILVRYADVDSSKPGWLDAVQLRYSAQVNYYTALNLTKLDVLDSFTTIKVAVAYKDPATGQRLESFPADLVVLQRAEVEYQEVEGWKESTKGVHTWEKLPQKAQAYIELVEDLVGYPVKWIGTGKGREAMIMR